MTFKGQFFRTFDLACGGECHHSYHVFGPARAYSFTPSDAKRRALLRGFVQDAGKGWLCPDCAAGKEGRVIPHMPPIVCLCGSTRFGKAFDDANCRYTLDGWIVLSIGCNMKSDSELFGHLPPEELARIKAGLDELHKRKIDLAGQVYVLNVGGYIGESTASEIAYAKAHGKSVIYLEPVEEEVSA